MQPASIPLPSSPQALRDSYPPLLTQTLRRGLQSRFFGRRLFAAGVTEANAAAFARDPARWQQLPLTTKEDLRRIPPDAFHGEINIARAEDIAEYWRSGGSTGEPLFYPRTRQDMPVLLESFRRTLDVAGVTAADLIHVSFPLGVHPAGQCFVRAAQFHGAGVIWAGAGNNTPSEAQVNIISQLQPTVWAGMGSYGLHLSSLAELRGIRFNSGRIRKLMTTAEMLTETKRRKLQEKWGGPVHDSFGASEIGMMAGDCGQAGGGMHLWTDLYYCEVLHPETQAPVAEGEEGMLVATSIVANTATPFIRWVTGDIVTLTEGCACGGPYAVFPVLRHARRTTGFFKVKGVNINHTELEDLLLGMTGLADFRVTLATNADGLEYMALELESDPGVAPAVLHAQVADQVRNRYGLAARIRHLDRGTLAREFDQVVKAVRFVDQRE